MKKLIVLLVLLCATTTASVEAQNWLDALKQVATDVVDDITGGQLTAKAIIGTWNYKAPATRLEGGNVLSNVGGALAGSTINDKLKPIFEKVGIREGFCTITFNEDGTFAMPIKGKALNGTYEFDPSTHAITLKFSTFGSFTGYAYISGSNLELVFPVDKLVNLMKLVGSKISALSTVTSLLENVDNAYLGFAFAK